MPGDELTNPPLLLTKFHRPIVPSDHVHRARLMEQLDKCYHRPLALVSAPAGYGKSTLVSAWLDGCEVPNAWLSLDESDDDLRSFLIYFLAALESMFPDAVGKTKSMVNASKLPSLSILTGTLVNELDAIGRDFILVLDDIHYIKEESVHAFFNLLLQHPPQPLHLVMIGRRDPFLAISTYRARVQLVEIRVVDLRFSVDETASYLKLILDTSIDKDSALSWAEKTEGWVTGLRLAALSIKHRGNFNSLLPELVGGTQYVMEYLFNENLSHQPAVFRDILLKTSILDRFCAPLCEAICGAGDEMEKEHISGWSYINWLKRENLFLIHLDTEGRWYRYHHLFQQLLQNQLRRYQNSDHIAELHCRAAEWFEDQGLITESIKHDLAGGNIAHAADTIEEYRYGELAADRWHVVERWLSMLPVDTRQARPKLLLTEAWINNLQHQMARALTLIEQAESLITGQTTDPIVVGELAFMRGYVVYYDGQAERSRQLLEEAVSQLAGKKSPFLGEAELMLGLALCQDGQKDQAVKALEARISEVDASENYLRSRLIAGLVFIYLLSGDLFKARVEAKRLQLISEKHSMRLAQAWSYYLIACTHLHTGEFEAASFHFAKAVELRYELEPRAAVDALAGLVLTQQFMQLEDEASESCQRLQEFALELNESNYLSVAQSCRARLSVLQGALRPAVEWGRSFDESPVLSEVFSWLEAPSITQVRVLIADGTEESLNKAFDLIRSLRQLSESCHFTCQTIEIAILQSMALEKQGRGEEALNNLEEVMVLAGPRGWIRPFVEAGPPMADLLKRLRKQNVAVDYIEKVLTAFPGHGPASKQKTSTHDHMPPLHPLPPSQSHPSPSPLAEPLTNRELEVLELLAQRLQNKEIASKLSVSPTTVRTHLQHIYQKLCINSRRKAVETAEALGILSRR